MKLKTLKLYLDILFKERKKAILLLLLHSFWELVYNLGIVLIPTTFLSYLENRQNLNFLIVLAVVVMISAIFKKIYSSKLMAEKEFQDQILIMQIVDKMNRIPYYLLEKEEIKQKKESCLYAIENYGAVYDLFTYCIHFVSSLLTLFSLIILAITYHAQYIFIVIIFSIGLIYFNYRLINHKKDLSKQSIHLNYAYQYYQEITIKKKYQINHRLYRYNEIINDGFASLNHKLTEHFTKIRLVEAKYETLCLTLGYFQQFCAYYFPIKFLFEKTINISTFILLLNVGLSFSTHINQLSTAIQKISQSLDYLKPIYDLMNLDNQEQQTGILSFDTFESLEFRNVSFTYPNTTELILNNVSFMIRKNDKVAIIGQNGQGKTTLVKLILRLYQPDSGQILINGVDVNQYDDRYLDRIAVVFQDCTLFPITLFENIAATRPDKQAVLDSCHKVGLNQLLEKNQLTLNHLFSSEVHDEGIDLSKGEKQLFAIARALNRDGHFVILDEPSSALDPIMRNRIISHFNLLFESKTTILITHDETFARQCDVILKLQNHTI